MIPTIATRFRSAFARFGRLRWAAVAMAVGASVLLLWFGSPRDILQPVSVSSVGHVLSAPAPTAPESQPGQLAHRSAWRPAAAPPPSDAAGSWGRRIIRQAGLDLELDDVDAAIARLTELVETASGYVAETQVHSDGTGTTRASITAYVPPAAFGRTLRDLERLGRPTARRVTGQDVSEEFVDLEARVRNLERHEAQVLGFMGKAQKVADLLALENELARVRGEIERLTGRIRFLRARTEMAGIQVTLVRAATPAASEDRLARAWARVHRAFVAGWKAAFDVAVGLAAVAAQLSPLALPALLGWGLYRRVRRPAVAPPPAATP